MRALLVLVLAACSSATTTPTCPRPTADPESAPLLWRATKEGAAPIWLFGTIHHAGAADIPTALWPVIDAAQHLYTETGALEADADEMRDLVRMPHDQPPLQRQMSDDDWYELRDALRGTMREDELARSPPWYVLARLRATVAPPPTPTMDVAIVEWIQDHGRTVTALETPASQLGAVAKAVTVPDLLAALHERHTLACRLHELLARYQTRDLAELERRLVTREVSALLGPRNARWLKTLTGARGTVFAAVGLGHLLGSESLLVMLEREGYVITRAVPPPARR